MAYDQAASLARLHAALAAAAQGADPCQEIYDFLQQREQDVLAQLANPAGQPAPAVPNGCVEFGFALYWIHNRSPELVPLLSSDPGLLLVLDHFRKNAPASAITADLSGLADQPIVASDGTLLGFAKYEQLDPGWVIAVLNYGWNHLDPARILPFPTDSPVIIPLTSRTVGADPVIGIVGDWGAGFYPEPDAPDVPCSAERVMKQLQDSTPPVDYLIHLGDAYYAGTPGPGGFEALNFVDLWPDQLCGYSFALNSNHELYAGDQGYFNDALAAPAFSAQNKLSRFALSYGHWLILGLDSAYYSDAENGVRGYMFGAIGTDEYPQQMEWLQGFRDHHGPIMVLSHHGPCDATGSLDQSSSSTSLYALWTQVQQALNRSPAVWYWGHLHNAIVYKQLTGTSVPVLTKGRCLGHGSIPFGLGSDIVRSAAGLGYYACTPDPELPGTPRLRNGYALVTPHADGGLTECFYETGEPAPVYTCTWTAAEIQPTGPAPAAPPAAIPPLAS